MGTNRASQRQLGRRTSPAARVVMSIVLAALVILVGWGVSTRMRSAAPPVAVGPASERPNVLLISIDMLRPDHLHCYGYERATSPRLDQLAGEGVLFENHISSTSWTLPAHAALFTALVDSVHGCIDTDKRLPDTLTTLAEHFAAAGYQTAGLFSGPYLHPAFGLGQGFEHYENCTSYARAIDTQPAEQWALDADVERSSHEDVTNPLVYAAFQRWLAERGPSPFFMFIHMWDPHFDFIPPPPYDTMFDPDYEGTISGRDFFHNEAVNASMPQRDLDHLLALYDGEIAWTDEYVGKMVDDLRAAGLLDQTIIAITSDHGTEFYEHGGKAHRMTLYDEVIRVPLIIRYPELLAAGRRVSEQTRIIDIGPTLLDLAGLPPMPRVMGHSLTPLAAGGPGGFDNTAISELFSVGRRLRTLRSLDWKFTHNLVSDRKHYMNLEDDPAERIRYEDFSRGLGIELLNRYRRTEQALEAWRAQAGSGAAQADIPPDVLRQLESLGYVGDQQPE